MKLFLTVVFVIIQLASFAQQKNFQVAFYNVENLFDTIHDSYKNDYEFLPDGKRKWTSEKYWLKQHHTARVITGLGNWQGADVVGLCEVENNQVLWDLTRQTYLKGYNYIHHESDDVRGIDVAFLYKKATFKPLFDTVIKINLGKGSRPTRDILYVKGIAQKDTLHFFINHWSSRWGGKSETEHKRILASKTLRNSIAKLRDSLPNAQLIVMGDFNDTPQDKSLQHTQSKEEGIPLINLVQTDKKVLGTLKYQNQWSFFDQIIISKNVRYQQNSFTVYHPQWLFMEDAIYGGNTLYRSFKSGEFLGGYSDHFPVYIYLK